MKIIIYGAQICPDCVNAKEAIAKNEEIQLDYRNITEPTAVLKEFLKYRIQNRYFSR